MGNTDNKPDRQLSSDIVTGELDDSSKTEENTNFIFNDKPSAVYANKPPPRDWGNIRRWTIIAILVLVLLLFGFFCISYQNTRKINKLHSLQNQLQSRLDDMHESDATADTTDVAKLVKQVSQIYDNVNNKLPKNIQEQYQKIIDKLTLISQSSNQTQATLANQLIEQLTNHAGEGINLSGNNNSTISNTGVLSVNNLNGHILIKGVSNQTDVTQNGSTLYVGTIQDISTSSSPTFQNLNLNGNLVATNNISANTLSITSAGTQNGNAICDASNNCGFSSVSGSYVQGGNSFGAPAVIGTTDNQPFSVITNNINRLSINNTGDASFTGNLSVSGTISGDGSGLSNVNASQLNGQSASYYLNASNIGAGTLSDSRLSSNVTLQGNTFNGANQLVRLNGSGGLPAVDGSGLSNVNATQLNGQSASYYLNASNLNAGTLSDARLSANVPLKIQPTLSQGQITSLELPQPGYYKMASRSVTHLITAITHRCLDPVTTFGTELAPK